MQLYGKVGANFLGGEAAGDAFAIDYLSDTIKATLHNTTYVPAIDTDELFAAATNELTTANGYTAGGVTLGTKTISYNATGNVTTVDCADFGWTAAGGSLVYRYAVIWRDATDDVLIGYIDQTTSGNFTLADGNTVTFQTGASGLFQGTVT